MFPRCLTILGSLAISLGLCVASARLALATEQSAPPVDAKLPAYSKAADRIAGKLRVGGGGTTERFLQPLLQEFTKIYPDVSLEISLRGSGTVPTGLSSNEYNLGVMSRAMTAEEEADVKRNARRDVVEIALAADAILVLVNKDNPVEGITLPQLDALYGTKRLAGYKKPVSTWADLGVRGDLAGVKISPYGILEEKNGTVETFRLRVLRGGPLNRDIGIINLPHRETGQLVAKDRGGISYNIDLPPDPGARAIGVAAREGSPFVLADPNTVGAGKYPLSRYIYAYCCDPTDRAVVEFLRFALSRDGQQIVAAHHATPLPARLAERHREKLGKPSSTRDER